MSLGPHPFKDLFVMGTVVDMIMRILDPGILSTFVQFETFISYRSYLSTVWEASINGLI